MEVCTLKIIIITIIVTVHSLLSPTGGLFFSSTFEGGELKREGGGLKVTKTKFLVFKNVLSASCSLVIFMRMVTCIDVSYTRENYRTRAQS